MNRPETMNMTADSARSIAQRYGLAVASVAASLGLSLVFTYFHLPQTFGVFALTAIAVTFWYAGTGPGILAALLSSVVRDFLFDLRTSTESRLLFDLAFLVFALLMMQAVRGRNQLELRVVERTAELARSNDNLKREITERTQAEYLTGQVFEYSPDAILIIGTDYRYKRANPVHARNWAKPAASMVGMHVAELAGVDSFERKLRPYLDRCFAGESVRFEDWFNNALGHRFLAVSYSPLRFGTEQVEAALVIARDFTEYALASEELRQAQADLAHASRMTTMGELTASLAHEVNQPITAAVNGASACVRWLTRADPDLGEAREAALGVIRNAKRAADIINRIRSIAKKGESKRQLADINELTQETIALLRNEANRHSVSIITELEVNLPMLMVDSVQVQQVMMNLIMNSIDAMKDVDRTREIRIRSRIAEDQQLMISVSDTGVGLPSEQANQIFDAFFTTKTHGLGMGLRISRSIVEAHGGRLWAADNTPHGASFHFTLSAPVEVGALHRK
jgi:C4-dicarboxylate-specific signal transduction histidine kinase